MKMIKNLILIVALISGLTSMPTMEFNIRLQPKQLEGFRHIEESDAPYMGYGGAKFGGKSYLIRASEFSRRMEYGGTHGGIFRKTYPELLSNHILRFFREYPITAQWYKAKDNAIYYPNGSITFFKHLARTMDVYKQQGIEYDDISLDEATQHEEEVFKILKTSLRSDPLIIEKYPNYKRKFKLTFNPGGIGHAWVKRLFIDRQFNKNEKAETYHFIQAMYRDNPIGIKANPEYIDNLMDLPEDLRRAYLDGDWDIFIGQFFQMFRYWLHGIDPIRIEPEWGKIFAVDWGYFPHPYHIGWYAQDFDGNVYKYREATGFETSPEDVGELIVELSAKDKNLYYGVGDTQMWEANPFSKKKQGVAATDKSIATEINSIVGKKGMSMLQANKSRKTGWTLLRSMMQWKGEMDDSGEWRISQQPKYRIFNTCETTLAAYPNQIHSELVPEDMMKQDGDDPPDTDRYALMHIFKGQVPVRPKTAEEKFIDSITQGPDDVGDWEEDI